MHYALDFAPNMPPALLWALVAVAIALTGLSFALRAPGAWARALALAIVLVALAHPLIVREVREGLPDVVALIVDRSQSMDVRGRRAQADAAAEQIRRALASDKSLEVREASFTTRPGEDTGTQLFSALQSTLASAPPERVAGAIAITDGEVHDPPLNGKRALNAPLQALIAGQHGDRDRKLTISSASRFAIVGQNAGVTLQVDDFGAPAEKTATIIMKVDGVNAGRRTVLIGRSTIIHLRIAHAGENVIELEAQPGTAELTLQNNRAVIPVTGVRDRLRVLLVSGEPHAGERVWRSLLKADPSVDLVHFTILRPPDKQDATPITELSLIAFPTRELFVEKLEGFDLVIFDRCSTGGGLSLIPLAYFENIARYVESGGALLIASGPEFADQLSIYRTPLAAVLPAQPTGQVIAQPFKPVVTDAGLAHPVTRDLPGANTNGKPPSWGAWFRLIGTSKVSGETVMAGPDDRPLLVLDRVGKGRVAEFLSDQEWLWARRYDGGGPQAELLRRLAHWLMKEPELEEERLSASIVDGQIAVERHTMAPQPEPVTLTYPSGRKASLTLNKIEPGLWRATANATDLGLYRLTDGKLNAVTAAGPLNPKEVADMRATDAILKAPAEATGGSVHWLADSGVPDIRRVDPGAVASGDRWIGLRRNGAYRVTSVEQTPLLPPWLAFVLVISTLLLAWRAEAR
ncbi:MAG: hypothetical protein JO208_08410 [Alphaproteobacteria bacterium]|nr:hypothetical protein [Alphaproteobacteria bacterium]